MHSRERESRLNPVQDSKNGEQDSTTIFLTREGQRLERKDSPLGPLWTGSGSNKTENRSG
jgi:hypothetical protein